MRGLGLIGTARSTQALARSLHSHDPNKQKQAERALRLARRRSDHPLVNALLERAQRLAKRGNPDRALDLLAQCATLLPQHPEVHYRTGTLLLERSRFHASEQAFSRALELDPDHFDARLGRALCRFEMGRTVEARMDCLHAIKINPNMEEVRLLLLRR